MNTLTFSESEKDHNRALFQRQDVPQDHGTRKTRRFTDDFDHDQKQRRLASLRLRVLHEAEIEALEHFSPAQLKKAANKILRTADYDVDGEELYDELDADIRRELEYDEFYDGDEWVAEAYFEGQELLRQEFTSILNRGKAVNADPEYRYGGVDDSLLPDYMDGFHITDRP